MSATMSKEHDGDPLFLLGDGENKEYDGVDLFKPATGRPAFNFSNTTPHTLSFDDLKRAAQTMRETKVITEHRMPPIGPTQRKDYEAKGWIRDGRYTQAFFVAMREQMKAESEARGVSVEELLAEQLPECR